MMLPGGGGGALKADVLNQGHSREIDCPCLNRAAKAARGESMRGG